jgi:hypothetical protein
MHTISQYFYNGGLVAGAVVASGRRRCVSGLKVRAHERMLYEGVGDGAS